MAQPKGQTQQSSSRRLADVPNGLPTPISLPHDHVRPVIYQTPDTFTTPHTPVIPRRPDQNLELTVSNPSPQAYGEQLQQAFDHVETIIRHRIQSDLSLQYSNYWNRHWNHHYAQLFTASDHDRLELEKKVNNLTVRNNALEADNGQFRWKCAQYRKTVFRHVSALALQRQRMQDALSDGGRLRARILNLKVQHAKELQMKQLAMNEAERALHARVNGLEQAISSTEKSFKEEIQRKQELFDEQVQFCNSLEALLQEERDRVFDVKKDLALSNVANAKCQKEVQEATMARDVAEKNEEAERQLSMERVNALQDDIKVRWHEVHRQFLEQRCDCDEMRETTLDCVHTETAQREQLRRWAGTENLVG